ncbi:MAG: cellulase family glycosylhydrolase [Planctomycetota bacterium]|jgi:hypothetical protein
MNKMTNLKRKYVFNVILKLTQSMINMRFIALLTLGVITLPSRAASPLPELTVPNGFGVNIHFRGEPRDLDLISDAGFTFIRTDLTWGAVEREKGLYEFEKSGYDALTKGCSKRGIRILYILDYSNRLYESDRSVRTEQGRRAFAAFAEAAARRYAGKGILWEIWNEPNIKQFWRPQPSVGDYCKLVEETAPRITKADPSGLVIAGATSTIPFNWLQQCFEKGLLKWIDVLSVYPYRPQAPETVIEDYVRLRELITRYAPIGDPALREHKKIPIISGEWGYSNLNWDKTRLSNDQQAQYLVREFLINLYQGIPVSIWYDWKNDGTNPNEREHNFGTVTDDLKTKAAYLAAKTLASTLKGYRIEKRLDLGSEKDFAFKLTKNGNEAVAFWTMGKEHEVTLPIRPGKGMRIDMLGSKTSLRWQTDGLKLTVSQSPQYLLIKRKPR